jgi:hypothetical protein
LALPLAAAAGEGMECAGDSRSNHSMPSIRSSLDSMPQQAAGDRGNK